MVKMKTGKEHLTKEWLNLPEDQIYLRFLIRWIETAKEKIWGEELPSFCTKDFVPWQGRRWMRSGGKSLPGKIR